MSSNGKRVRRPAHYVAHKDAPWQPGDEMAGAFSHEQLLRFDATASASAFCAGSRTAPSIVSRPQR